MSEIGNDELSSGAVLDLTLAYETLAENRGQSIAKQFLLGSWFLKSRLRELDTNWEWIDLAVPDTKYQAANVYEG